jgi:hypothetical protein
MVMGEFFIGGLLIILCGFEISNLNVHGWRKMLVGVDQK